MSALNCRSVAASAASGMLLTRPIVDAPAAIADRSAPQPALPDVADLRLSRQGAGVRW